jgi:hypothetical protein
MNCQKDELVAKWGLLGVVGLILELLEHLATYWITMAVLSGNSTLFHGLKHLQITIRWWGSLYWRKASLLTRVVWRKFVFAQVAVLKASLLCILELSLCCNDMQKIEVVHLQFLSEMCYLLRLACTCDWLSDCIDHLKKWLGRLTRMILMFMSLSHFVYWIWMRISSTTGLSF